MQPSVRDDLEVVVWREGLKDGDGEAENVLVLGVLFAQHKGLVVEDHLLVHILDQHPELLGGAMHSLVVLEVGREREVHSQHRARDRLNVRLEFELKRRAEKLNLFFFFFLFHLHGLPWGTCG